jgi:hypothetical protein
MLELPQGLLLQVENEEFGHWQPLKIRDLEICKNFQEGKKYLGMFGFDI